MIVLVTPLCHLLPIFTLAAGSPAAAQQSVEHAGCVSGIRRCSAYPAPSCAPHAAHPVNAFFPAGLQALVFA
jgi:hypothetical protein